MAQFFHCKVMLFIHNLTFLKKKVESLVPLGWCSTAQIDFTLPQNKKPACLQHEQSNHVWVSFFFIPRPNRNAPSPPLPSSQTLCLATTKDKKSYPGDGPHPRSAPRVGFPIPALHSYGTPRHPHSSPCVPMAAHGLNYKNGQVGGVNYIIFISYLKVVCFMSK